jgi:hypothetical protein
MITSLRQPAQGKRRTDSGIVGQATTDEPIDRREVPCYPKCTLALARSGGVHGIGSTCNV